MRRSLVSFWPLLFLAVRIASAQGFAQQERDTAGLPKPITTVSFAMFHNRIYLPVEVNGNKAFELVLDTGAAVSGLSEASARSIQLATAGKAQLAGNGESRQKIALAKDVTFRVGTAELMEKSVAIVPFEELEAHEGRPIEGVLGVNLFRRYVVVINYAAKTLALYEPLGFVYRGAGERIPLRLGNAALFHASIELPGHESVQCDLSVDSGTYSALRLYRPFVQKHHLLGPHTPSIESIGFGIGGEFPEKLGRVGFLRLGSLALKEPVSSFSDARGGATSTGAYDGTIGGAVLRRFKVTIDYPHQQMVLEPNADFSEPFLADTSGLILGAAGRDLKTIAVLHVLGKTPAAVAGIKDADAIVSVNGEEASSLGLERIRSLFAKTGVYHLQLQRGQQALEIDIATIAPLY